MSRRKKTRKPNNLQGTIAYLRKSLPQPRYGFHAHFSISFFYGRSEMSLASFVAVTTKRLESKNPVQV